MVSSDNEYHGPETIYNYRFCPLKSANHIRTLQLEPGQTNQEVTCQLACQPLKEAAVDDDPAVDYEALSYTWGKEDATEKIHILTDNRLYIFRIRRNLHHALQTLRFENRRRRLWIDALCIDQNTIGERNHQVAIMSKIYDEATEVSIWLGEADEDTNTAIRFIKQINIETFDGLSNDPR